MKKNILLKTIIFISKSFIYQNNMKDYILFLFFFFLNIF